MGQWFSSLCFLTLASDVTSQCLRSAKHKCEPSAQIGRKNVQFDCLFFNQIYVLRQGLYSTLMEKCLLVIFNMSLSSSNKIAISLFLRYFGILCKKILKSTLLYQMQSNMVGTIKI